MNTLTNAIAWVIAFLIGSGIIVAGGWAFWWLVRQFIEALCSIMGVST